MFTNYGNFSTTKDGGLGYMEFWPALEGETGSSADYDDRYIWKPFSSLVAEANVWLQQQTAIKLINCETVSLKYMGLKNLDVESTKYGKCACARNHYIFGLRLWYEGCSSSSSTPPVLEVLSFAPTVLQTTSKYPIYKPTSQEYQQINREITQRSAGKLLNVQTVEIKPGCPHGFNGQIDVEKLGYKEHYYHKCIIQFTRVYILKGVETISEIGFKDFLPGKEGSFAISSTPPLTTLIEAANDWLLSAQFPGSKLIGAQVLENHYHGGKLGDSDHPFFDDVERTSHTTIKYLRLHFVLGGEKTKPEQLHLVNLEPEATPAACCQHDIQKLKDHINYMDRWVRLSGARVLNIQSTFAPLNETFYGDVLMRASSMGEWDWGGHKRGPIPMHLIYFQRLFILGSFRQPTEAELPHVALRRSCTIL